MLVQVNGPINDDVANLIVAQLLFLESENPEKPVRAPALTSSAPARQQQLLNDKALCSLMVILARQSLGLASKTIGSQEL